MLPAEALTLVETVEDELSIATGTETARLERLITAASSAISAHLNRVAVFDPAVTEKLWSMGQQTLLLSRTPLVSVTSVVVNGVTYTEDTDFSVDDLEAGVLYRRAGWWTETRWPGVDPFRYTEPGAARPERLITVVYAGGWVTPQQAVLDPTKVRTLPAGLEHAALLTVGLMYRQRGIDPNVSSEQVGDTRYSYRGLAAFIPDTALALLRPYRRVPL